MNGPEAPRPGERLAPARCQNCDAPLTGDYCAHCGQSTSSLDVPVTDLARDLASEALSLDSRLRLTLQQLFMRPGLVAREFVAGRRARFVPPIRLYLFASFAMFLTLSLGPGVNFESTGTGEATDSEEPRFEVDLRGSDLERSLEEGLAEGFGRATQDPGRFTQDLYGRLAQAMFFLLPIFGVMLKGAYPRRLYVHHVVFAIYLHSFAFIVVALVALPEAARLPALSSWFEVLLLWIPAHFVLAAKRFYGGGWLATVLKAGLVSVGYGLVGAFAMLGLLAFSILNA